MIKNDDFELENISKEMYNLAEKLFPICRSITGNGVRETLNLIGRYISNIKINEIKTGTKCFDWNIPKEWNVEDAFVATINGEKVIDFKKNNLHLVSYSVPVDQIITRDELLNHLHVNEERPFAIPYVTSYYKENWGFCTSLETLKNLNESEYKVVIKSELKDGSLTFAEVIIPGESKKEVFLSTYTCHPSMGNNETSGPVLATFLTKFIQSQRRKYTYRIIFIPETIGAVAYLSLNLNQMKENIIAGFQLTCVGDNRTFSFMPSRYGNTYADRVAKHVLKHRFPEYMNYSFLQRGSDERQYCSPGIDLPVVSIMRSKYACYPEYHTSDDNLDLISPEGFKGSYDLHRDCINIIEKNAYYRTKVLCEPQLGKRGLRSNTGGKGLTSKLKLISDILVYADGELDVIGMAELFNIYALELIETIDLLIEHDILEEVTK